MLSSETVSSVKPQFLCPRLSPFLKCVLSLTLCAINFCLLFLSIWLEWLSNKMMASSFLVFIKKKKPYWPSHDNFSQVQISSDNKAEFRTKYNFRQDFINFIE